MKIDVESQERTRTLDAAISECILECAEKGASYGEIYHALASTMMRWAKYQMQKPSCLRCGCQKPCDPEGYCRDCFLENYQSKGNT